MTTEKKNFASGKKDAKPQQQGNSDFLPLVFGGALAAALGMVGSALGVIGGNDSETAALRDQISIQQERIAKLEKATPLLSQAAMDELRAEVDIRISRLETNLGKAQKNIASLDARPIFSGNADTAAYEKQLVALEQSVKKQRSEINALLSNAKSVEEATTAAARRAAAQTALSQIVSAIDAGQPFESALSDLKLAGVEAPEALASVSGTGVASLANLQDGFPASARAALSAARSNGETDEPAGIGSFLKQQLGARSITPQEGDNPDAVLSRAEAALKTGDVMQSLQELETLTPAARDAMSEWINRATVRTKARSAVTTLSQRLNQS